MFVKLLYWNYSGDRGPQVCRPWPRLKCWVYIPLLRNSLRMSSRCRNM